MVDAISNEFKKSFMEDKHFHDSLSRAIKLAKQNGIDDKLVKTMTIAKQESKEKCAKNNEKMLRSMPLSDNIVHLCDSWYTVRYLNDKGDLTVKQECLWPGDVSIIRRDGRHERELSRVDLDNLLPAMTNEEALELYKQSIRSRGCKIVYDYTGVILDDVDAQFSSEGVDVDKPITVSSHAGVRWIQRVTKYAVKDDKKAEEHRRIHSALVNSSILDSFGNASQVWKSDQDGITYWFNSKDNIMFVVGSNNIITLYEEDFGFTKSMNSMIVGEQLKVLSQVYDELLGAEDNHKQCIEDLEGEIQGINNELLLLEDQVALLVSRRATLNAQREQNRKGVKLARTKYEVEFDKLFKKWDM